MSEPDLVPVKYRLASDDPHSPWVVHIEERIQMDGPALWAVTCIGRVLTRSGEWEMEPIPSERNDAFRARTRFPSPQAALAVLRTAGRPGATTRLGSGGAPQEGAS